MRIMNKCNGIGGRNGKGHAIRVLTFYTFHLGVEDFDFPTELDRSYNRLVEFCKETICRDISEIADEESLINWHKGGFGWDDAVSAEYLIMLKVTGREEEFQNNTNRANDFSKDEFPFTRNVLENYSGIRD